jgi:hypothetical protein
MATLKMKDEQGRWIISEDPTAVKYTKTQNLTEEQKRIARENIGVTSTGGDGGVSTPILHREVDFSSPSNITITYTQTGNGIYESNVLITLKSTCAPVGNSIQAQVVPNGFTLDTSYKFACDLSNATAAS